MSINDINNIIIHSDGGSRGNPGPSAIGYVIEQNGQKDTEESRCIGLATNNEAEHIAIQEALRYVSDNGSLKAEVDCFLDSELVVRQLQGIYKIKNERLRAIAENTFKIIQDMKNRGFIVRFTSVKREYNARADSMVNKALDSQ